MSDGTGVRFERVQILRFVAAAAVVLFHAQGTALRHLPIQPTYWLFGRGASGVDLFFVISGLIIRYTVHRREQHPGLFLRRRIERIVPLYWACTIGFLVLVVVSGLRAGGTDFGEIGRHFALSLFFLGWTAAPGALPIVYVGWSLEYEMLFYLLTAAWITRARRTPRSLALCLVVPVVLGRALHAETGNALVMFLCNPILLEFLFGVLIAEVLVGQRPSMALAITLAGLATVPFDGWGERVWFVGLPSALLVALAALADRRALPLNAPGRLLARLGDASYSIYLVQVFTISGATWIVTRLLGGAPLLVTVVSIASLTIAAGYATFLAVERPLLRLTHWLDRGRPIAAMAAPPTTGR